MGESMKTTTKTDRLDTLCLDHPNQKQGLGLSPLAIECLAKIEMEKQAKKERLDNYIEGLVFEQTNADTLKKLVAFQRANAPSKTMRICNTVPIQTINDNFNKEEYGENLTMKVNEYGYGMHGLNRCKNPFCPMCSRSRAGERAHKLKRGIQQAQNKGYTTYFVTLTIKRSGSIKSQLESIRRRWGAINNLCSHLKRDYETEIYKARALDITFNPYRPSQRYHLHLHCIFILENDVLDFSQKIKDVWIAQNKGKDKADYKGQDVQKVGRLEEDTNRVGRYVAKMAGLAMEITHGQRKEAKNSLSVTLKELMLGYTHSDRILHSEKCIEIYQEFLEGMKRTNTLTISRNWKNLYEEEEEEEKPYTIEIEIPVECWNLIKNDWFYIAEKVQFEIFQNSVFSEGEIIDTGRVNRVIDAVEEFLEHITTKKEIFDFCTEPIE